MNKLTKKEAKSLCLTPVVLTILLRLFLLWTNKLWNQLTKEKEIFIEGRIKMAVRKGRESVCVCACIYSWGHDGVNVRGLGYFKVRFCV